MKATSAALARQRSDTTKAGTFFTHDLTETFFTTGHQGKEK